MKKLKINIVNRPDQQRLIDPDRNLGNLLC